MKNKKRFVVPIMGMLLVSCLMSACVEDQTETKSEAVAEKEIVDKSQVIQKGEIVSGNMPNVDALQSVNAEVSFYDNVGTVIVNVAVTPALDGTEKISEQTVKDNASIYEAPTTDSQIMGKVTKDEKMTVYGDADSNGFIKVDYKGRVCYIQSSVLSVKEDTDSSNENKSSTNNETNDEEDKNTDSSNNASSNNVSSNNGADDSNPGGDSQNSSGGDNSDGNETGGDTAGDTAGDTDGESGDESVEAN